LLFVSLNKAEFNISFSLDTAWLFIKAMRFDLSAIFMANSLFILMLFLPAPITFNQYYLGFLKWLFLVTNGLFLLVNLIDIAYFPFIHKRMQADALLFLNGKKGNDFFNLLPTFIIQYWYLLLVFIGIIYVLNKTYQYTHALKERTTSTVKNYVFSFTAFLFYAGLTILGIRGGLQMKPIDLIHASEMAEIKNIPAILNTPFAIIKTMDKKNLSEVTYFSTEEINSWNNGVHLPQTNKAFTKENVVVIVIESLSKKYVGMLNGTAKTPFIDSLLKESLLFTNGFANARESIQGIPAITASIPSLQDEPFIFSPYSTNKITSLANLLKKQGYSTSFYHGGTNGTMGFDSYSKLAGFDQYYGRTEFNNEEEYAGSWGIWDEPFLQYMAQNLSSTRQPFFSTVFTLNPHHPYKIPEKYAEKFKQAGPVILPCISYVDYALRKFFETAKKQPWFNNTLFVITADHTSPFSENDKINSMDEYRIPIALYKPSGSLKGINTGIANQMDVMPTVLNLLNFPEPYFSYGNDLLNSTKEKFAVSYNAGVYQYIDSSYCYHFNGEKALGLYNWRNDSTLAKNLLNTKPLPDFKKQDQQLKKMIQWFNASMNNNKMHVE
jgi:phosphoglycerol transferase MdoB-like AlkP superfamily enzyme